MIRRSTPFDWLVVGLGNPGKEFSRTRHNVGEEVVAELARRRGDRLRSGRDNALVAESRIGDERVVLAFPLTYVNESGMAVRALARRYGIEEADHLIVVHDELDLPPTTVRIKVGGGLAGHNGLRSIVRHVGSQDFLRVRIGVGKPPGGKERGADHVLSRMPSKQRELFDVAVQEAADAVELIVTDGVEAAMRRVHGPNSPDGSARGAVSVGDQAERRPATASEARVSEQGEPPHQDRHA